MKQHASHALAAAICVLGLAGSAAAEESQASRAARWHDVAAALFKGKSIQDGAAMLQLDAPPRALDAALVPVTITMAPSAHIRTLTLVIDDNPAPVAGIIHFGPLGDPNQIKLRVRIDQYTLMHVVAERADGSLVGVARFIKAAGGCSAPGTTDQAAAMARIGRMKLLLRGTAAAGQPETAELLISHPNNNGMQMDPVTRLYTPARYVQTVTISQAGARVLTLDGDISLSEDPAITFSFRPASSAPLDVEVDDSAKAVFRQSFPITQRAS
jgi:sulfur-oxidizing protein SoxY